MRPKSASPSGTQRAEFRYANTAFGRRWNTYELSEPDLMSFVAANGACLCGRYTLLEKVGAGGEGEVWRARDHERGIELALKILDAALARNCAAREALNREFAVASVLDHPLILKVYAPERDADTIFLPMDLAPGGDLRRLRRASYLEIGPVLLEVAQALSYVHESGFVHRDLKPGNVLLDARGHIRLADFSMAARIPRPTSQPASAPPSTEPVRAGFSPFTASPEQLRGEAPSVADDVYGLGALACELLSGHPPDYTRFDIARRHNDPLLRIEPAHQTPERLIALVTSMLSRRADQRPRSMRQVIERLEAVLADTLTFEQSGELGAHVASLVGAQPLERAAPVESAEAPEPSEPIELVAPIEPDEILIDPESVASRSSQTVDATTSQVATPAGPARSTEPEPPIAPTPSVDSRASSARAPMRAVRNGSALDRDRGSWRDDLAALRASGRPQPKPRRSSSGWPWLLAGIAAAVAAAVVSFPHWPAWARSRAAPSLASLRQVAPRRVAAEVNHLLDASLGSARSAVTRAPTIATSAVDPAAAGQKVTEEGFKSARAHLDSRLETLDARGAANWGGQRYADVRTLEAEAIGADEAGDPSLAVGKLAEAERGLDDLERHAPEAAEAQSRNRLPAGVLSLLGDGLKSERAGDAVRAELDFNRALALDPHDAQALAGLRRVRASLVARARRARDSLQPAPVTQPDVNPAFELPPALHRSIRAELERRLRALVAEPVSLESQPIRDEAAALIREERATPAPGPALQSLAARLSVLLETYRRTVRVALVSDDQTQVQITQIGSFGAFLRREIDLRPGEYTVVGQRAGYKEVRREVIIEPGAPFQLISVRCETPI